jgi:hypothetical protein
MHPETQFSFLLPSLVSNLDGGYRVVLGPETTLVDPGRPVLRHFLDIPAQGHQ